MSTPMAERGLTEGQRIALKWADCGSSRTWSGIKFGSPPRSSLNALLRRGLVERVGVESMDLYRITPAGRSALTDKGVQDG